MCACLVHKMFFIEQGFVIVEDFLPKEVLDAVRSDIEILVENLAQKLYKAGRISGKQIHTHIQT